MYLGVWELKVHMNFEWTTNETEQFYRVICMLLKSQNNNIQCSLTTTYIWKTVMEKTHDLEKQVNSLVLLLL